MKEMKIRVENVIKLFIYKEIQVTVSRWTMTSRFGNKNEQLTLK